MKTKTTGIWFALAASLFAAIWFYQKNLQRAAHGPELLLPGLRLADVARVQITPGGQREISAVRSNGLWLLQKPLAYPAQTPAVEALVEALAKISPAVRLTAADMREHKNADADFGFENPQFNLLLEGDAARRQLIIGQKTAPGDQVYIRVVGTDGAYVTDAAWLALLPRNGNDWRDSSLVDAAAACDWIVVTNGPKIMEFRRNPTNQLWRMTRPLQTRADETRLAAALQQLRQARAEQFVTDNPNTDLSAYGLQPAEFSVWLGTGTNLNSGIIAGKATPEKPGQIYARRAGWNAVVTADKDTFASWRGAVNEFRDARLVTVAAPVAEIEIIGPENFTLQRRGTNGWAVTGEKFSADPESVQNFFKLLAGLRVSEYVKDVVSPADLQGFGLATPARQIVLRGQPGDTNPPLARLIFGDTDTNRVFVKRGGEDFVYALKIEDLARLPEHGWEFRDHRLWNFSVTNIAQVTLKQAGKTRVLIRTGENKWSLGPGSQGIINPPALEETFHRLGDLAAAGWVGRNVTDPEKYGLNPDNLAVTIELTNGEKFTVNFGTELAQAQTALAAVTLDNERWIFVFPPVLFQFVTTYLAIPPNAP